MATKLEDLTEAQRIQWMIKHQHLMRRELLKTVDDLINNKCHKAIINKLKRLIEGMSYEQHC